MAGKRSQWIGFAILFWAVVLGKDVGAHPHVFVDARAGFKFNAQGQLHALRISWTYDAFTTLLLFDVLDLDKDGDGNLDEDDRAAIVAGETNWQPDYNGDVYLEVAGQNRPLTRPENARAWMEEGQITIAFDLPLAQPEDMAGGSATLRLYDPRFYYAYTILADGHPLGGLPDECKARVIPFEPDTAATALLGQLAALSREEMPEQDNVGRLFSDEAKLRCG